MPSVALVSVDDHYGVLGVQRDATDAEVREAYRGLARRTHPDRVGEGAGHAPMSAVNEAYRVLRDPGRRALYDRSRLGMVLPRPVRDEPAAPTAERSNPLVPAGPARVPWRLMAIAALVGSAVVLAASLRDDPPGAEEPDGIIRSGSCIGLETNGDAREVACTGTGDIVVVVVVPLDVTCPVPLSPHRDRLGLGIACVAE